MFSASYDVVHDDADGPDIHTFGILVFLGYLRSHIKECPYVLVVTLARLVVLSSKAEVDNLDARIISRIHKQDVGGFQIAMDHTVFMDISSRADYRLHNG